jgi:outer membrane immunogenic protein
MRKIAMIAAAAALASAPQLASAADLGGMGGGMKDVPPPVLITNWTGFYGSIGVGFGAVVNNYEIRDETWVTGLGVPVWWVHDYHTFGAEGVLGTVQLGYDYQFPASRWLIGAFVDYDWEHFSGSKDYYDGAPNLIQLRNYHAGVTLENQWNVGGRLGVLTSPETMFYVLLAYTQAQEKAWLDNYRDFAWNVLPRCGGTGTLDGVTVGAGLETHLKDNWFLKVEYRFSQLSNDNAWQRTFTPWPIFQLTEDVRGDVDADIHTARIALTYKFSRQGIVEPLK